MKIMVISLFYLDGNLHKALSTNIHNHLSVCRAMVPSKTGPFSLLLMCRR